MKRPSFKKIFLSLSLCISLLCYPYADVLAPAIAAVMAHADKIVMGLTALAFRLLSDNKPLQFSDIQYYQELSKTPTNAQNNNANTTITYSHQALNNKVCLDQEANTITTSIASQRTIELPQQETQPAPSKALSITARQPTLASTFKPMIVPDIAQIADRALGKHNQHNVGRTIELTGAHHDNIPYQAQETKQNRTHSTTTANNSYAPSHQQVLQEAQKNSDAIDNAVHNRYGSRMSELQRNINALSCIRNNPTLSAMLDEQYGSFLHAVELCGFRDNKPLILESLLQLADQKKYAVLKQVPYLAQRFDEAVGTLHHLCLNEDGSLRAGGRVGHETEVARIIANFNMPLGGGYAAYEHIVNQLVDLKVMGARNIRQELIAFDSQSFFAQAVDGVTNFFRSKETYAPITKKFIENPFNIDMLELIRHCKLEQWDHAKAIADRYQAEFNALRAKNIWRDEATNNRAASQAVLCQLAYENGVFKKYQHHPYYQQLKQHPYADRRADVGVNKTLEDAFTLKELLLQQLNVTHPSPIVDTLAYHVAPIFYDPVALNQALSCLSKDHPDKAVQDAYSVFFDEKGISRLSNYNPRRLEGITLPECINNASHAKTRVALNTLLKINIPNAEAKKQFKIALNYIQQACLDAERKDEYTTLAAAMCNAMIVKETDKTILSLGDFTELYKTEEQRAARLSLMRDAAMLYEKINQPNIGEEMREDYRKKFHLIETTRKRLLSLDKNKQSALNAFYNDKIRPSLETIGAYNLAITYAQFIHNELATPTIPAVGVLMKEGEQQNNPTNQDNIPPQLEPDPEDPDKEKKSSDIKIDETSAKHMFGNREGHIPDTPANRELLLSVANSIANFLGRDERGWDWYAKILENGKQVWVQVRNNLIRNGGINDIPHIFNSETGLCRRIFKS